MVRRQQQMVAEGVLYMRLSGDRGWQKHAHPHRVTLEHAAETLTLAVADSSTQAQREVVSMPRDVVYAAVNGATTLLLTLRGQPLRKIALTFSTASDLTFFARKIHSTLRVKGIEGLPGAALHSAAAHAALTEPLPDLSAPAVRAYAARLLFDDSFHEFVCQLGDFLTGATARLPSSVPDEPDQELSRTSAPVAEKCLQELPAGPRSPAH